MLIKKLIKMNSNKKKQHYINYNYYYNISQKENHNIFVCVCAPSYVPYTQQIKKFYTYLSISYAHIFRLHRIYIYRILFKKL